MNADHFRKLFDYNYWAHHNVWGCVLKLSDEQYYRPCNYSVGSVHNQVAHTYSAEYLWLGRARQDAAPRFPALDEHPDRTSLRAAWDERVNAALAEATLERPASRRPVLGGRAGRHSEHLGHLLTHMQFLQRAYPGATW